MRTRFAMLAMMTILLLCSVGLAQGAGGAAIGGAADATAPASGPTRISLAEAFFIQRHPVTKKLELLGSLIIWLLLALSVVCVGLLGAMALENRRRNILPDELRRDAQALIEKRDFKGAMARLEGEPSDFAQVLRAALSESVHGYAAMVRAAEQVSEELMLHRLRRIEPLNVIGNVAPMIGLFGTVYGMILAFREIVAAGGTPDPVGLAAGIGTALVTTFWGLIVAIPALAGYALIRNSIDGHAVEGARTAEAIISRFRPAPGSVGGANGAGVGTGAVATSGAPAGGGR